MILFENTEVFNFKGAISGMRNPLQSWHLSDSNWYEKPDNFELGKEDLKLAMTLSKAGKGHDKFLRQILISVDIVASELWWKEMDTYKVATVANSTSMMHTLGKEQIRVQDFGFDEPNHPLVQQYMQIIQQARNEWVESGKKKPSPEWRLMNQLMAIAFLYERAFTANYGVLKSVYHDRANHRLVEWEHFRIWVRSLHYSDLITLGK